MRHDADIADFCEIQCSCGRHRYHL
jgi:hypothetical protein